VKESVLSKSCEGSADEDEKEHKREGKRKWRKADKANSGQSSNEAVPGNDGYVLLYVPSDRCPIIKTACKPLFSKHRHPPLLPHHFRHCIGRGQMYCVHRAEAGGRGIESKEKNRS
jgi:hypothetical protein